MLVRRCARVFEQTKSEERSTTNYEREVTLKGCPVVSKSLQDTVIAVCRPTLATLHSEGRPGGTGSDDGSEVQVRSMTGDAAENLFEAVSCRLLFVRAPGTCVAGRLSAHLVVFMLIFRIA